MAIRNPITRWRMNRAFSSWVKKDTLKMNEIDSSITVDGVYGLVTKRQLEAYNRLMLHGNVYVEYETRRDRVKKSLNSMGDACDEIWQPWITIRRGHTWTAPTHGYPFTFRPIPDQSYRVTV